MIGLASLQQQLRIKRFVLAGNFAVPCGGGKTEYLLVARWVWYTGRRLWTGVDAPELHDITLAHGGAAASMARAMRRRGEAVH